MKENTLNTPGRGVTALQEDTRGVLVLLREWLEEARAAGDPVLKLDPNDVARLCAAAGVEGGKTDMFRALVRQNLVRLRGRWRENRSAIRAPVYIECITEAGMRVLDEPTEDQARRGSVGSIEENLSRGGRA